MLMKIVTYVAIALLVVALGFGAFFYLKTYQPLTEDYVKIQNSLPELKKVKTELAKYKEEEDKKVKETAWVDPAVDALYTGLDTEIKAGKAEVFAASDKVLINIAEQDIYMPGSYTFTRESTQLLSTLATLLRSSEVKGRDIVVGNTTQAVPAQGKGRKKIPAKDARTLAADRSAALVRYLEKNGIDPDVLIAAAYSAKQPAIGYKLKSQKITIIIEKPPMLQPVVTKQDFMPVPQSPANPGQATKKAVTTPATPQSQYKGVPIQPKAH